MSENSLIKTDEIQRCTYTVRGVQVMLDRDLAVLYGVKPIRLREQVRRNIKRFPSDFMFQLTEEETDLMVSQNAIPSRSHLGGYLKNLSKKWLAFSKMDIGVFEILARLGGIKL